MPRNGSGVYSKPAGTTAITNTIIDPVPWNALTTDLGNEITNSLPRDGSAGMVGAFQAANGTNATPSITFVSDTGTGIYRKAASTGAFVSAGAEIANWSPSGFSVASALSVTGGFSAATITATSGAIGLPGALFGLTLSNDPGDLVNDIAIAVGMASSDASTPFPMVLASSLTKRLDATWAVGTGNGGLDTGSVGNNTYYIWLIQRSDTGVVDALFSLSSTAPTMPTNYDRKRRIGSVVRVSAANLAPNSLSTPSGMDLIAVSDLSAAPSTVDFTNLTAYDEYLFSFSNIRPASAQDLYMLISTNNGSSYVASGYQWARNAFTTATPAAASTGSTSDTKIIVANALSATISDGGLSGELRFWPNSTGNTKAEWTVVYDTGTTKVRLIGAGFTGIGVNAIRFLPASGSFGGGGFIRQYGLRKG